MRTLLDDEFAPTTTTIGFLRASIDDAVVGLRTWRERLGNRPVSEPVDGLRAGLIALQPLVGGARPRELLVAVGSEWTAYFDCRLGSTDAVTTIGYLSQAMETAGVAITSAPHTVGSPGHHQGQYGAVQFELFGHGDPSELNSVRSVELVEDGGHWVFQAIGEVQPFEDLSRYQARSIRERFTSEMLETYCRALGIDAFEPAAYGPRAFLVRSDVRLPADPVFMTFEEAQKWFDIHPGEAAALPG